MLVLEKIEKKCNSIEWPMMCQRRVYAALLLYNISLFCDGILSKISGTFQSINASGMFLLQVMEMADYLNGSMAWQTVLAGESLPLNCVISGTHEIISIPAGVYAVRIVNPTLAISSNVVVNINKPC